jgi:hypothetical protein
MKALYFILLLLMASNCFGQTERKVSTLLSFQVHKTLYDRTITNNNGGFGFGLQTTINTKSRIKPTLALSADHFAGTKELYLTADGRPIDAKSGVLGIYTGALFQPSEKLFIATTFGASIFNNKANFGIRPLIGFYPSKNKKWAANVSFTNVFQRDGISDESFGYISFAMAFKLL